MVREFKQYIIRSLSPYILVLLWYNILTLFLYYHNKLIPASFREYILTFYISWNIFLLLVLIFFWLYLHSIVYKIYDEKVSSSNIFFYKKAVEIPFSKISILFLEVNSILDRLFKTWTISFITYWTLKKSISIKDIKNIKNTYISIKKNFIEKDNTLLYELFPDMKTVFKKTAFLLLLYLVFFLIGLFLKNYIPNIEDIYIYLFFIILGIILFSYLIFLYIRYRKFYYSFYSNNIEFFEWFFIRKHIFLKYDAITSIKIFQSFFDRILSCYKVVLYTTQSNRQIIKMKYIKDIKKIDEMIEKKYFKI